MAVVRGVADEGLCRACHRRAAAHLGAAADADWRSLARAAAHSVQAGAHEASGELLERAAQRAVHAGRPDIAADLIARRLDDGSQVPPAERARLYLQRFDHAYTAGIPHAIDDCVYSLSELRPKLELPLRIEVALRLAQRDAQVGRARAARRRVDAALTAVEPRSGIASRLLLLRALLEEDFGRLSRAVKAFETAAQLAAEVGEPAAELAAWLGVCRTALHVGGGTLPRRAAERAIGVARASGDRSMLSDALRHLGNAVRGEDLRRAADYYRQAIVAARESGLPSQEAKALNNLGIIAQSLGELPEAVQSYSRSILLKERIGSTTSALVGHNNLGALLSTMGRRAEARGELQLVLNARGSESPLIVALAQVNMADLLLTAEDLSAAVRMFRAALESERERTVNDHGAYALTGLIRALAMRAQPEDLAEAKRLEAMGFAERSEQMPERARRFLAAQAMLADAQGEDAQALAHARRALQITQAREDFSSLFGNHLEAQWIEALLLARRGELAMAQARADEARRTVGKLKLAVGDANAQELFLRAHPMHAAIVGRHLATPRGWTWKPRLAA